MMNSLTDDFYRHIRWWFFYISVFIVFQVCLTSVGAFFHFLLDHEISIVEGWLHKNGWELTVTAKFFALLILHRFLKIRMYRPRGFKDFLTEEWRWPDQRVVISVVFLLTSFLLIGKPELQPHNFSYVGFSFITFVSFSFWTMADCYTVALLQDLFPIIDRRLRKWQISLYMLGFVIAFRMIIPDYFATSTVIYLHFFTILLITGSQFQIWSNALVYLLLFAAPMAALFGIDPIWGADFSPFKIPRIPHITFLLIIWMLSLAYYRYRHRWRWPFMND